MKFGTPFVSGGLKDQPIRFFNRMRLALNVYEIVLAWKNKPARGEASARWYAANDDLMHELEKIWSIVGEEDDG